MSQYICYRCNYTKDSYYYIKRHLNKKNICNKTSMDSIKMSDDQNIVLSLIPYHNEIHDINIEDLRHMNNSNILFLNRHNLFEILDEIEINKMKTCKFCTEEFSKMYDLRYHIVTKCFYKYLCNENEKKNAKNIEFNNSNGNNVYNNNIINNITNNGNNITNNIYLEIKPPVPFDNDWDLSRLDENIKARLLLSQIMYTTLLDEILKNENNLNVIIDKDSKSGLVYKNDVEKYTPMKLIDILDESMDKLKNYLLQINDEASTKEEFERQILRYGKAMVLSKYRNYKESNNIKANVNHLITNLFDKKKKEAIDVSKKVDKKLAFPNGY